jgi:hypothetical protein
VWRVTGPAKNLLLTTVHERFPRPAGDAV